MATERVKILVPVDFDGSSRKAIEAALWLTRAMDADLVLLHVHDRPSFAHPELPGEMIESIQTLTEQAAIKSLAALAMELGTTRTLLRHGDPATTILETAKEVGPAMIVMGTHGRSGLSRIFIGSVAAQIVRGSPVPVVTVRGVDSEEA